MYKSRDGREKTVELFASSVSLSFSPTVPLFVLELHNTKQRIAAGHEKVKPGEDLSNVHTTLCDVIELNCRLTIGNIHFRWYFEIIVHFAFNSSFIILIFVKEQMHNLSSKRMVYRKYDRKSIQKS